MKTKNTTESTGVSTGKCRGRPRAFCCEKALDAATRVFWEKGYEGASLPDLTEAMGINRPSMYSAFGNKETLFRKVMERYVKTSTEMVTTCLSAPSARDGLRDLMRRVVGMFTEPNGPHGCLMTQGQMTCADTSPEMQHYLSQKRAAFEVALRQRLGRAIDEGELPAEASIDDLARYFAIVMQGISLQAKGGGKKDELLRVVDVALERWPAKVSVGV